MTNAAPPDSAFVPLGHITRPHGVHGAFIIVPYTENPESILLGRNLKLMSPDGAIRPISSLKGKEAAQGLIVKIFGVKNRDEAKKLSGWSVGVFRGDLPGLEEDELYWADLLELAVYTKEGETIGRVARLLDAGAGLLLAIVPPDDPEREILLPFNEEFVVSVDLPEGRLVMDPPPGLLDL